MKNHKSLKMLIREYLMQEGIYDQGILKAVFMAGGPGSGKSHTAKLVFGGDTKSAISTATASGLKLVNSDPAFELFLNRVGISPGDLGTMSSEDFGKVTVGSDSPRGKAKKLRDKAQAHYMDGRLGIVIDGTGDDYEKIATKKARVEAAGYDTMMIFINTSLRVAQERNKDRARKLPAHIVEDIWDDVQENMGSFQSLFGRNNFFIVDNTKYGPIPENIEKAVMAFLRMPVENPIGKVWIESELGAKGPQAELPKQKS